MKICSKCGRELNEIMFYKDKSKKDGLATVCKECRSAYGKERYQKVIKPNLEKINEDRMLRRRTDNEYRERVNAYKRKRHAENREADNKKNKEWYENNKERVNAAQKAWYENNKQKHYEDGKRWIENNRDKFNEHKRERIKNDEVYHLKVNLRCAIGKSFSRTNHIKESYSQDILGCTIEEAKEHLEQTWFDNYGTPYNGEPVHIDHIIPLATAKTKEDVIKLCHISNLQYLKPEDNLRKKDSLCWPLYGDDGQMRFI